MAGQKYSRSTPEFRAAAVGRARASGLSIAKVAAELDVNPATLWKWVNAARLAEIDPGGVMPVEAAARIRDLERENARLRRDLEFEKKAGAFFRELDHGGNGSL
jgi:transposase-like protein